METKNLGAILIVFAMLLFGLFGIFSRLISSPVVILILFFQISGLFGMGLIVLLKKDFSTKGQIKLIICYVIVNLLADFSFLAASRYTSIANAVFLKYTGPIYVLLLSTFLLKEQRDKKSIYAVLIALTGLFIIIFPNDLGSNANTIGIALGTIAGITLGLCTLIIKKILNTISVYTALFYRFLISAPLMTIVVLLSGIRVEISTPVVLTLLGFGFLFAIVGTVIHFEGISRLSAQRASVLFYIEPLSATIFAVIMFSETPTFFTLLGGALIIISTYLIVKK